MIKDSIYNTGKLRKEKQSLAQKRANILKSKPTESELIFKYKLDKANIRYIFQKICIAGNNLCIADFYLPSPYKLVIEIDGKYHESEYQTLRDKQKNSYYRNRGFRVKHIKNEDVINFDVNTLIKECDAKYKPKKLI